MLDNPSEALKRFGMTNQLVEHDLDRIEVEYAVDLGRQHSSTLEKDEDYYPQIERDVRAEAARMAPHYEVFYALERTIRSLVADTLETEDAAWWQSSGMPPAIRKAAEARFQKDVDTGTTPRSEEPIDFCTFGELGEIIKMNWDVFGGMFRSPKAVERVMSSLNSLRGPIAHCSPLAEDEVVRLRLTVRDWFRLMD